MMMMMISCTQAAQAHNAHCELGPPVAYIFDERLHALVNYKNVRSLLLIKMICIFCVIIKL